MKENKVKLYDEDRHFIGETRFAVSATVRVLRFGDEFFIRCADHENCFTLTNGKVLKNSEVGW